MKYLLTVVFALLATSASPAGGEPTWWSIPATNNGKSRDWVQDINSHRRQNFQQFPERFTHVHENTHLLDADISNELTQQLGKRVEAFYVGNGKAAAVEAPRVKRSQIRALIPLHWRLDSFYVYMVKPDPYNGNPDVKENLPFSSTLEELNGYVNGTLCEIEDAERRTVQEGAPSAVRGCLELLIYSSYMGIATEKHDPKYLKNNEEFRKFYRWQLLRAAKTYRKSLRFKFPHLPGAWDRLAGPQGKEVRDFWERQFGREFVAEMLGN